MDCICYLFLACKKNSSGVCPSAISILDLIMMHKTGHIDVTSWNMNKFVGVIKGWVFYCKQRFRYTIGPCSEVPKDQNLAKKRCSLGQILTLKISHVGNICGLRQRSPGGVSSSFTERFGIALCSGHYQHCILQCLGDAIVMDLFSQAWVCSRFDPCFATTTTKELM